MRSVEIVTGLSVNLDGFSKEDDVSSACIEDGKQE